MKSSKILIVICRSLLLMAFFVVSSAYLAQEDANSIDIEIFVDEDYLIVYVPSSIPQTISLRGLTFIYIEDNQEVQDAFTDTVNNNIDWNDFNNLSTLEAPICMIYRRVDSTPQLPVDCRRTNVNQEVQEKTDTEVWWYDQEITSTFTGFRISNGSDEFGQPCVAGQSACEYRFIPQTTEQIIYSAQLQGKSDCGIYSSTINNNQVSTSFQIIVDEPNANEPTASIDITEQSIAYLSSTENVDRIYTQVLNNISAQPQLIWIETEGEIQEIEWSPDTANVIYTVQSEGSTPELFVLSVLDGESNILISGQTENVEGVYSPFWMDQETIYFTDRPEQGQLYRFNDTEGLTALTVENIAQPKGNYDNQRLALVEFVDDNDEISIYSLQEENITQLTYTRIDEESPIWSPNDEYVAFITNNNQIAIQSIQDPGGDPTISSMIGFDRICDLIGWVR